MPISVRISTTSRACSTVSGCEMSRTCNTRSASSTSSSVARNAATNCVGKSEINPTVSERMTFRPDGSSIPRIVGSSVANNISFAITFAPVILLKIVDLPALVYPTNATIGYGIFLRAALCKARVFTTLFNCVLIR